MKDLDKILDIKPANQITVEDPSNKLPAVSDQEQVENDLEYARDNLYDVAEKGKDALYDMIDIARQSQHPKAYEALNQVLKTLIDVNTNIVELQIKKQKLEKAKSNDMTQQITNNLFVGSTADLQQMLASMNNKLENDE